MHRVTADVIFGVLYRRRLGNKRTSPFGLRRWCLWRNPGSEEILMMSRPRPTLAGIAFQPRNTPFRLMAMMRSHSFTVSPPPGWQSRRYSPKCPACHTWTQQCTARCHPLHVTQMHIGRLTALGTDALDPFAFRPGCHQTPLSRLPRTFWLPQRPVLAPPLISATLPASRAMSFSQVELETGNQASPL
jgi:hypothetical protein